MAFIERVIKPPCPIEGMRDVMKFYGPRRFAQQVPVFCIDAGQDLFGQWNIEVSFGRIGRRGRSVTYSAPDDGAATSALPSNQRLGVIGFIVFSFFYKSTIALNPPKVIREGSNGMLFSSQASFMRGSAMTFPFTSSRCFRDL